MSTINFRTSGTLLANKTCIVTGAANGIGRAIAEAFAREQARLVLTDINTSAGQQLAKELCQQGCEALFLEHDVTDEQQWQQVFESAVTEFGGLQVLVNNAGGGTYNDIENLSLEAWQGIMSLNLDSCFIGTQLAIKTMKDNGGGSIINVSSIGGLVGSANLVAYSSAKAGVKLLTKCAALHCGQNQYNIRINSVHPGLIKTESGLDMASKATGMSAEEAEAAFATLHPIGRIGLPSEIAEGVLFLASNNSSFMTGSELVIDGGYTAQ